MRSVFFPILLGLAGVITLVYLGTWQVQRLAWKQDVLAGLDIRLAAPAIALPLNPLESTDEYRRVTLTGTATGDELHVLASGTSAGTGYRVITAFALDTGRRILLDHGLLPLDQKASAPTFAKTEVRGTLLWPDDINSSTPDPDIAANVWFGRDIQAMAETLNTEPLLVVASTFSNPDARITPLPINSAGIKNDHLEYAITWFSLAFVWAVMSGFLIFRTLRPKETT